MIGMNNFVTELAIDFIKKLKWTFPDTVSVTNSNTVFMSSFSVF